MSRVERAAQPKGDLRETAAEAQQNMREAAGRIREAATETFGHLRDEAEQVYEQSRERALDLEQALEDYVRQKPIRSLLIAAGIGMLVGAIWKRS